MTRHASLIRIAAIAAIAVFVGGCTAAPPAAGPVTPPPSDATGTPAPGLGAWPRVALAEAWTGLDTPVGLTGARDGSGRILIVEKGGRVRLVKGGALLARPFLDISSLVSGGGEQGLLGLAFPPRYADRRHFYVYYTDKAGDIHVARCGLTADPDVADARSLRTILKIAHPVNSNHNGGQLAFGADGYLYVGVGDGGGGGDRANNAQNLGELKGKLLRIDVESGGSYLVPPSNPFVGRGGARPEIWAYGLRNPWRFSFDRMTGDLWIGDVGQNAWEEIDLQPAGAAGGRNYGWRLYEGTHPYEPRGSAAATAGLTFPVNEYGRSVGGSVTGGYVYRGVAEPGLRGVYYFADWVSGRLFGLRREGDAWVRETLLDTGRHVTAFGEDDAGEIYVCDGAGTILRLVSAP